MVKNPIVANPNINETELSLRNQLLELFAEIKPAQFISVWSKSVQNNRDYRTEYEQGLEMATLSGMNIGAH